MSTSKRAGKRRDRLRQGPGSGRAPVSPHQPGTKGGRQRPRWGLGGPHGRRLNPAAFADIFARFLPENAVHDILVCC
jgi:hypothetical protein